VSQPIPDIEAFELRADEIYRAIMPSVRGMMWERRLSYTTADRIAAGVMAGARALAAKEATTPPTTLLGSPGAKEDGTT
jgi:hypothetical protein